MAAVRNRWDCCGGAAGAAWIYGPQVVFPKSTYVVQVFEKKDGAAVPDVKVRVKSLPSEEQATQLTDAEGLARFRLRDRSVLALGLEYTNAGRCTGAKLPAFSAPKLPAVTPVYLDTIPPRLKGACGPSGSSDVSATSVRTQAVAVSVRSGTTIGDQGFLRYHLPWGVPAAPLTVSRRPYVVGFDPTLKLARWVGYRVHVTESRRRQRDQYLPDPLIPTDVQAPSATYATNPYDRGNFVRRLDVIEEDEPTVFYLSVIAPQADRMNQGVWVKIEDFATRESRRSPVWVLTGPAFLPAPGSRDVVYPILAGDVPVPTHWFRVTIRKPPDGPIEALSFLVPNTFTVENRPEPYLASVEEIERVTGLQLLSDLPEADRARIKTKPAAQLWTFE